MAADGEHQRVGFEDLAVIGEAEDFVARPSRLSTRLKMRLQTMRMPFLFIASVRRVAHVLVEAAQDLVAAIDQRHFAAQAMEDVGELDRDIAAAGDHDAVRQLVEMEGLVGGDGVFGAEAIAHVAAGPRRRWR